MARFLYQLAFSTFSTPKPMQVHVFLTKNRDIDSWYAAFPGCYLFKSDELLIELQTQFTHFFGETQFLITYVPPNSIGGLLPESIWQWTRDVTPPQISFGG